VEMELGTIIFNIKPNFINKMIELGSIVESNDDQIIEDDKSVDLNESDKKGSSRISNDKIMISRM